MANEENKEDTGIPSGMPKPAFEQVLRHIHNGSDSPKIDFNDLLNQPTGISFKVGTSSRSAGSGTGTQAITGIGFEPRAIIVYAFLADDKGGNSIGFYDGTDMAASVNYYSSSTSNFRNQNATTTIIVIYDPVDNNDRTRASITFDSDGFTFNWVENDIDIVYGYLAFS